MSLKGQIPEPNLLMSTDSMPPASLEPSAQLDRELEWQLAADDLAPVRRWLAAHPALHQLRIDPLPPQRLRDTYLDTADWRVFRSGFALRQRQAGTRAEATLKSLRSARADLADRREITETLPEGAAELARLPGPVGAWLRHVIAAQPLRTLFMAQTLRERFAVHRGGQARPAGEIALDETSLFGPSEAQLEQLLRVEVEVWDAEPGGLAPLVEALRQSCRLRPASENKFAAGVRAAGLAPPRE
ncbi:CYTH domain-containing protein [Metallibacterium sp.]|uniref:CYTH domain-containing protein n=1 Tax=Metallibacterium sp. TaxID=2940281 RepID=UPI00260D4E9E|nr:CYTH domain-containing protein [Metallibacterium sp.]